MPVRCFRVVLNLLVVAFFALMLDGFVNRDPYVRLPNGYAIVAISGGSPCDLTYERDKDPHPHCAMKPRPLAVRPEELRSDPA